MRDIVILITALLWCICLEAAPKDGVHLQTKRDTVRTEEQKNKRRSQNPKDTLLTIEQLVKKPHSPHKATLMAMVLPGSAQLYNGQWWKVPILYAGIAADVYGIVWNQKRYRMYRDAYIDWVKYTEALAENPDTPYPENPAWDKIPKSFDVRTDPYLQKNEGKTWFRNILNNKRDNFKRNRDLCYIVMAAIYAINIIDATVYAHFYDFEIDEDLSLHVQPTSYYSPLSGGTLGLTLTLNF